MEHRQLSAQAVQSLAVQARWLMRRLERHLLGNHLFCNAKALIFAGIYFEGAEASRWLDTGLDVVEKQLDEQILPDGGHFELSTMYHALAIEDLLDLINLFAAAPASVRISINETRQRLAGKVPLMLAWLDRMCHPDGEISFFNDAAMGIAPSPHELFSYASRVGFAANHAQEPITYFQHSGYVRLQRGPAVVLADVARIGPDYLPGHAHADTLSFELSLGSRRVIVNSGTSNYGVGPARSRDRSTDAHSTAVVDGQNSSEVWASFRVGRRAYPLDVRASSDHLGVVLSGTHDGYTHLPGRPLHRRTWRLTDHELLIEDEVTGKGIHQVDILLHLAPGIKAVSQSGSEVHLVDTTSDASVASVVSNDATTIVIEPSCWHPEFGKPIASFRLRLTGRADLPQKHTTRLSW
ncbi:heparinase [Sphingosinicella humi]|uniref:Heparinase n=1 Tax=Allosphingosinicella humi TaxID=2068657 RepID=A0A2U2J187_9SPHN|nr:heparinase [Sphingosinicella humi]